MFLINLEKCLRIFDKVYVSTDDWDIAKQSAIVGAVVIRRGKELCGDTPNIPVYQHALDWMEDCDGIVAVQANSPTIDEQIIKSVKLHIEQCNDEVMTTNEDGSLYGSVWAISKSKLLNYGDAYKPEPQIKVVDTSLDVHTKEDYAQVLEYYGKQKQNSNDC